MEFKGKSIISIDDFSKEGILKVLEVAAGLEENPDTALFKDKLMAPLFYEPSTRTRLSFVSAMERLGGQVDGFSSKDSSSVKKGESLWDTIKTVDNYVDIIVIRHPLEGAARLASEATEKPVVNAGDGANQHPTQTLLDMYTIKKLFGSLENLKIGMVGDLKYGRTVHSLVVAMSHFKPEFKFIAPEDLKMPEKYTDFLKQNNIEYEEGEKLLPAINDLDIIYMTRIQQERFPDPMEYEKYKGVYQINTASLKNVKENMKILHPLPRVDEIVREVDDTSHAAYFEQVGNGIPIRQALIALTLGLR